MPSSASKKRSPITKERSALRNRVKRFYTHFNRGDFSYCFDCIDPDLRKRNRVEREQYIESLTAFHEAYGKVDIWHIKLSLHLEVSGKQHHKPPFAFVYVFWRDKNQEFHVFQERWIKHETKWYTRVAGLVVHDKQTTQ